MPVWQEFKDSNETHRFFTELWKRCYVDEPTLGRHPYVRNLMIAAHEAINCGYSKIVAIEFGVAHGGGLLELCNVARFLRDRTGLEILVAGFDTGKGLPPPVDYRDHPELWSESDFAMKDPEALRAKLPGFAQLVIGDIADTLVPFLSELGDARIGFVAIDVDYYSSTKKALRIFDHDPEMYLPVVTIYFDDLFGTLIWNPWCGEGLAINEFNQEHQLRKLTSNLPYRILPAPEANYTCHVLDHPIRNGKRKPRFPLDLRAYV